MGYLIFSIAGAIALGVMFVSATDFKGWMTKAYARKKSTSLGVKAISGSVGQLRIGYFALGAVATLLVVVGIISLLNS